MIGERNQHFNHEEKEWVAHACLFFTKYIFKKDLCYGCKKSSILITKQIFPFMSATLVPEICSE